MDRNQKAAVIALIAVVILIIIAIGLIVYEVRTVGVPAFKLPSFNTSHNDNPAETFDPFNTPAIDIPIPSLTPGFSIVPPSQTPGPVKPSATVPVITPPAEMKYKSVFFGNYEQGSGIEPIEWLVLEENEESCVLISRYALEELKYHGRKEPVTWETSGLRAWLNREFLDMAFSPEEQSAILITEVDNSLGNPVFHTEGGNNTEDRVFLLSREEVMTYFPSEGERLCEPTLHSKRASLAGYSHWWTRSPGSMPYYADYISYRGAVISQNVDNKFTAIRPVLRVMTEYLHREE